LEETLTQKSSPFSLRTPQGDLSFDRPKVMGIINVTNDSFYKGSRKESTSAIVDTAGQMLEDGASVIDIGGMSSRPGAKLTIDQEEADKMVPAVQALRKAFPDAFVSIDTVHALVAEACLEEGISIINDISAGSIDARLLEVVAKHKVPYVLMHMKGLPENMQLKANYESPVREVLHFLKERIGTFRDKGIDQVIVDPGFGFGKTIAQNYSLLANIDVFQALQKPVMIGLSRKSMIWKTLETNAAGALNGTSVLHTLALMKGIQLIRTHDVKEAVEAIRLVETFQNAAD